jgi:hypothetical protein
MRGRGGAVLSRANGRGTSDPAIGAGPVTDLDQVRACGIPSSNGEDFEPVSAFRANNVTVLLRTLLDGPARSRQVRNKSGLAAGFTPPPKVNAAAA